MSGTFSILERYCPTYKYDYETKTFGPKPELFSDLMAEQAELAKKGWKLSLRRRKSRNIRESAI